MNNRVRWLEQQKERREQTLIEETQRQVVESREKAVTLSWLSAGCATIAAGLAALGGSHHIGWDLSVAAGAWMSALYISDLYGAPLPRWLRWAINAFAVVAGVVVIVGLVRH